MAYLFLAAILIVFFGTMMLKTLAIAIMVGPPYLLSYWLLSRWLGKKDKDVPASGCFVLLGSMTFTLAVCAILYFGFGIRPY